MSNYQWYAREYIRHMRFFKKGYKGHRTFQKATIAGRKAMYAKRVLMTGIEP